MSEKSDIQSEYREDLRRLMAKSYEHGRHDEHESAQAKARDKILFVGVACAVFGFACGLGAAGVL